MSRARQVAVPAASPPVLQPRRTRDRLWYAAVEAFAARGFHGTTTRDITSAAGVSPGGLYVHHASKEHLLYEITLAGHREVLELVEAAAARATDPEQQIREMVRDFVTYHAVRHTVAGVITRELGALTSQHRAEILEMRRRIEEQVCRVLRTGADRGVFRSGDVQLTAGALLSMGIDVARWYRGGRRWTPEQVGEHYSRLALQMLCHEFPCPPR